MYELMIVDADTPIFQAAKFVQRDFIIATNIESGKKARFKNKTEFWGHHGKKEGGVLAEVNQKRIEKGLDPYKPEDFEIEECAELNPDIEDHVQYGVEQFDYFVGKIKKHGFAEDYQLAVGGEGNFRYDIAQQLPYKGLRKDKPLLFSEIKEAILQKYRNKVVVVDGEEADDYLSKKGFENYKHFRKTGEWKWLLSFLDKDIKQVISPYFIYGDAEPEIVIPTPYDCAEHLCMQMLCGDLSTDNIPGLPNFTAEIQEKYSLGKTRGIGKANAMKYLEGAGTIKELFNRVCEAYKSYYGEEKKDFATWEGKVVKWNWLDYLQDSAQLLWLRREDNEIYNIRDTLSRLEIEYD